MVWTVFSFSQDYFSSHVLLYILQPLFQEEDMWKEIDHKSVILNSILVTYLLFHFINNKYMASLMSASWLTLRDPGNVKPRSPTTALVSTVGDSPVPLSWALWENCSVGICGSTTLWTYYHSLLQNPYSKSLFGPWLMCCNTG